MLFDHPGVGMAEIARHDHQRHAVHDHQRRIGVAQRMEGCRWRDLRGSAGFDKRALLMGLTPSGPVVVEQQFGAGRPAAISLKNSSPSAVSSMWRTFPAFDVRTSKVPLSRWKSDTCMRASSEYRAPLNSAPRTIMRKATGLALTSRRHSSRLR